MTWTAVFIEFASSAGGFFEAASLPQAAASNSSETDAAISPMRLRLSVRM